MKCNPDELLEIEKSLEVYKKILTDETINKINGTYNKFYGSFHSLFTTLCSEKIISEDPYGEENNFDTLEPPDRAEIPYNDEDYVMSIRLSHFYALLTFIKQQEMFSLTTMKIKNIEKIEVLLQFMDWDRIFDPQPIETNTEGLNKVLFHYQKDRGQKFVIASLKAATSNIHRYSIELLEQLNDLKLYLNEKYKLKIREEILPLTNLPSELRGQNIKKAHDIISDKVRILKIPLYIELIGEILKEDFTSDGEDIKRNILKQLNGDNGTTSDKKGKKPKEQSALELLKSSLIEISKAETQMGSILIKQIENDEMYRDENSSFIEKLIDLIKFSILGGERTTIYKLEIPSNNDEKPKNKSLEFEKFILSLQVLSKKLERLKSSENLKSILKKDEEEIQITLHQLLSKCRYTYKILFALNSFFKKGLNASKGIKIELKVILSAIDKAQATYFEYTKQKTDGKESSTTTYKPGINLTT